MPSNSNRHFDNKYYVRIIYYHGRDKGDTPEHVSTLVRKIFGRMQKIFHLLVWRSFYVSVDLSWRQSKYRENVSLSRAFQHIFTTAKFLNPIWHQWNCSWQILEGVQACQDCLSQERVSCFFNDVCNDPVCDPQHRQTRNDFDSEIRVNHSSTLAQLSSMVY